MAPLIFILFPTFDNSERATSLVRQLEAQRYPSLEIICVDHGTTPIAIVSGESRPLTVIRASPELWWAGAMNVGLRQILGRAGPDDAVVTINDDVMIGPEYIGMLAAVSAARPRALIGSVCINDVTDRVIYADLRFLRLRARYASSYAGRASAEVPFGRLLPCDAHTGRGTLIPARAFREVGIYDELRLPHYGADQELSLRASRRGFELLCCTDARIRTGPPAEYSSAGYRSFREFASDQKRPFRLPVAWAYSSRCFGTRYALWALALGLLRLSRTYVRERWLGPLLRPRGRSGRWGPPRT